MQTTMLDPIGAEISEVDGARLGDDDVETLRELLARRGVLVLREAGLDDAGFLAFLRSFGTLAFTEGEPAVPGFPDLNPVSNVGRDTPPRSNWHIDTGYVPSPPAYTALRAVEIPQAGGETLFADQYRALDTLPAVLRDRVQNRTMTHVVTGVTPTSGPSSAEHPLLRPHPLTGRQALYLDAPARCAAISGMDEAETERTVAQLLEHSTRADNVYRHRWAPGDVVIWDNACVLHRADHSGVVGDRVMHRGMVAAHRAS